MEFEVTYIGLLNNDGTSFNPTNKEVGEIDKFLKGYGAHLALGVK